MKIKQYDRVLLKDGCQASIVEIFEEDKFFLADIDQKWRNRYRRIEY